MNSLRARAGGLHGQHRHPRKAKPRSLLVDNYDSYTYNLYQLIADVSGNEPIVVHNDEVSLQQVSTRRLLPHSKCAANRKIEPASAKFCMNRSCP